MTDAEIRKELISKLKGIFHNKDFVTGVLSNATHPDDRKTLIEFIDNGRDVTPENIILLSVHLDQNRYG